MYKLSTFAPRSLEAAPEPGLPPPQALTNKDIPSARIAVRRRLNIKRVPFIVLHRPKAHARRMRTRVFSYIAAGASGTEPDWLNVQQQVLALPRTNDLCKGFVLGFL